MNKCVSHKMAKLYRSRILIQADIFLAKKGRSQKSNALQPLPHSQSGRAHGAQWTQNTFSPSAKGAWLSADARICFLSPQRYRGTGGVGHKNACLNKNVIHAPFLARTTFLSPPLQTWPSASSVGSETEKPFALPKRCEYITFRLPPETEMRDL